MPQTAANICDINISNQAGIVQAAVISGHAQITAFGLTRQSAARNDTIVAEGDGEVGHLYDVGDPAELLARGERLVCHGRVFKTEGNAFDVVCKVKQGESEVGTCAVRGQFSEQIVFFRIVCKLV